jgi:hypothetical protein
MFFWKISNQNFGFKNIAYILVIEINYPKHGD